MRKPITIEKKKIGENQPVFIIAEVGVNHNGSLSAAKKLIDVAVRAGADAVKFQMCNPEYMVVQDAPKAAYQKKRSGGESHYEMLKRLYFGVREHKLLKAYARKKNIIFFSTPFSIEDARALLQLKMPAIKVGSSDTNNHPQLEVIARARVPVILSTGMSDLNEVKEAVQVIRQAGNDQIVVLHCTTAYPTVDEDVHLRRMCTLRDELGVSVGYSDHTPGNEVAVAAVALGARMIEKHITLDRELSGPDHFASLEPEELLAFVRAIRRAETILGSPKKEPTRGEKDIAKVARKSIVAAYDIPAGKKIAIEDLAFKRPGTGLAPSHAKKLVGTKARKDILKDTQLSMRLVA